MKIRTPTKAERHLDKTKSPPILGEIQDWNIPGRELLSTHRWWVHYWVNWTRWAFWVCRIKRLFKKSVAPPKKSLVFRYDSNSYEIGCHDNPRQSWDRLEPGLGFNKELGWKLDPSGTDEENRAIAKEHWKNNP